MITDGLRLLMNDRGSGIPKLLWSYGHALIKGYNQQVSTKTRKRICCKSVFLPLKEIGGCKNRDLNL
jgi:hypothetical protein